MSVGMQILLAFGLGLFTGYLCCLLPLLIRRIWG